MYRDNASSVIAENIFAQDDHTGRQYAVLHKKDHMQDRTAIDVTNGYVTTRKWKRVPKKITKGWKLLCQWKDGSSGWIELKHLKDSNPTETAECAAANWIQKEPAF
jgi:hypothetical protein